MNDSRMMTQTLSSPAKTIEISGLNFYYGKTHSLKNVSLDRAALVTVQTPQAFRAHMLRDAHAGAPEATDDAALVERIGGKVVVVEGERANLKLTAGSRTARVLPRGPGRSRGPRSRPPVPRGLSRWR